MSLETAMTFVAWLQEKIDLLQRIEKVRRKRRQMSPQCIDELDTITASHRPLLWLPAFLLVQAIGAAVLVNGNGDAGEPAPTEATINRAIDLITDVPFPLLGTPDINPFYGEIHISWTIGAKQVVLMCFPTQQPLVHHYSRVPNAASVHDIEVATSDRLVHWLRWLRA